METSENIQKEPIINMVQNPKEKQVDKIEDVLQRFQKEQAKSFKRINN